MVGRCLKIYRLRVEGDGNAELIFLQRRVLLEEFDQKSFSHLFNVVRLCVVGTMPRFLDLLSR